MQRTLKRIFEVPEIAGREVTWTSFAWWGWHMALAFMSVSPLSLALLRRSHSLSVCVHVSLGLQMDCVQTPSYWSDSSLLLFDSWRSFLATWSRSTRLETRTKESNMCASFGVLNLQPQGKWILGYVQLQPTLILTVVWERAYVSGPENWWTMPENGKVRRNSGGGSERYWRANRSSCLAIGRERLFEPSGCWFPPQCPSGEVKFLDLFGTDYCESIWQGWFHWSRTKVRGSKTTRHRRGLNHKPCRLEIGSR